MEFLFFVIEDLPAIVIAFFTDKDARKVLKPVIKFGIGGILSIATIVLTLKGWYEIGDKFPTQLLTCLGIGLFWSFRDYLIIALGLIAYMFIFQESFSKNGLLMSMVVLLGFIRLIIFTKELFLDKPWKFD